MILWSVLMLTCGRVQGGESRESRVAHCRELSPCPPWAAPSTQQMVPFLVVVVGLKVAPYLWSKSRPCTSVAATLESSLGGGSEGGGGEYGGGGGGWHLPSIPLCSTAPSPTTRRVVGAPGGLLTARQEVGGWRW